MISPNTPPGTKVLCIANEPSIKEDVALWAHPLVFIDKRSTLEIGKVYEVDHIMKHPLSATGYCVILVHLQTEGCPLRFFNYLDLPSCLTDILTARPIKEPEEALKEVP